jgi:hypothetical protein
MGATAKRNPDRATGGPPTTDSIQSGTTAWTATEHKLNPEAAGLVLLTLALLFNAILLAPEIRIERVPVDDMKIEVSR